MDEVFPFPFATLAELKARWPDMPAGADEHAAVLLEDASQFMLDVCPSAAKVPASTRRRIVCTVVRRSIESESEPAGVDSYQTTTGPFAASYKLSNPGGGFYLTKAERKALGEGAQRAFGAQVAGSTDIVQHRPWCNLVFGAGYCSCGADIAGRPIFEGA